MGTQWIGTIKVNMNLERKFVLMSTDNESYFRNPFIIRVELCKSKSWYIIIHAQYWIVNKTGLPLFIQVNNIVIFGKRKNLFFDYVNFIFLGMSYKFVLRDSRRRIIDFITKK